MENEGRKALTVVMKRYETGEELWAVLKIELA